MSSSFNVGDTVEIDGQNWTITSWPAENEGFFTVERTDGKGSVNRSTLYYGERDGEPIGASARPTLVTAASGPVQSTAGPVDSLGYDHNNNDVSNGPAPDDTALVPPAGHDVPFQAPGNPASGTQVDPADQRVDAQRETVLPSDNAPGETEHGEPDELAQLEAEIAALEIQEKQLEEERVGLQQEEKQPIEEAK